jgi:AAA domain
MTSLPDVHAIARALNGEVRRGRVLAPGPGHSAADRSMSITFSDTAPAGFIVKTFSPKDDWQTCRDYIKEKLGLQKSSGAAPRRPQFSDDDIAKAVMAAAAQAHQQPKKKTVVATYDYVDQDGALLYQVLKYEPKSFSYRRPNGSGGWTENMDNEPRRVLYRWPDLLKYPDATVFLCEGEKDAARLAEMNLCATTVASGSWTEECVSALAERDVIILEDNDESGRKRALEAARRLHGVAKSVRIRTFHDLPDGGDASDWLDAARGRGCEAFTNFCFDAPSWEPSSSASGEEPHSATSERSVPTFPLVAFKDIHIDLKRRNYLVKGLLPRSGIVVVWGPPKCYKSFWAMDIGLFIALGWPYRDRRVQQAPVVYIGLEGREGLPARKEAFAQFHGIDDAPFYLMMTPLDLAKQADALIASIKEQLGDVAPGVVLVDTLNRSLVGSESKDEDMAAYLAGAGKVEQAFGCLVAIVHHCGIDASRPRGHTSLSGAVEAQLRVERVGDLQVLVTVELAKDFSEGADIASCLEPQDLGVDDDGDPVTSLVVLPSEIKLTGTGGKKIKGAKKVALDILRKAIDEAGEIPPASNHIPPGTRTISMETWRRYAYAGSITKSDNPDTKQKAFVRAAQDLQEAQLIGKWGDLVWLV